MKKNKKVVVFSLRVGWAGAEIMALKQAQAYDALGYDVSFYYMFGDEDQFFPKIKFRKVGSVFLKRLELGDDRSIVEKIFLQMIDLINFIDSLFLILKIKRIERDVDIIHFNKIRGLGGFVFMWAKLILKCRVAYTAHDYEYFSPDAKASKSRSFFGRCYRNFKKPFLKFLDYFVSPSGYMNDLYMQCFGVSNNAILIKNFLLKEVEDRSVIRHDYHSGVFGFLGRLEPIKGVRELVLSFDIIKDKKLIVAGVGSLQEFVISASKGNKNIEYFGFLNENNATEFFNSIDYLVVPSIWEEVFGLVVLESYARGVPVIVTDSGALPELALNDSLVVDCNLVYNADFFAKKLEFIDSEGADGYSLHLNELNNYNIRGFEEFVGDLKLLVGVGNV